MLISRKRHFIFIHIYKNAGSSVTDALGPFVTSRWHYLASRVLKKLHISLKSDTQVFPPHIKATELIDAIGKDEFDSCFSFAIVRNPWDWQVSLYKFMLKDTAHHQHELAKKFGSFDAYIRWRCAEEVRFQKDFIYSADGELLVDFVGRYERLDEDFATICSHIGVSASLPKLNVSNTEPYRLFYNEETRDLVRRAFDADITLFGYDF
jgi:Sulfotransferase family